MNVFDTPPDMDEGNDDQGATVNPAIGQAVGSRLKMLYAEFPNDDAPDRMTDLIEQLQEQEKAHITSENAASNPDH